MALMRMLFFRLSECSQFGHMKSLAGLSYGVKLVILIAVDIFVG